MYLSKMLVILNTRNILYQDIISFPFLLLFNSFKLFQKLLNMHSNLKFGKGLSATRTIFRHTSYRTS